MNTKFDETTIVTASELASWLDLTPDHVAYLARKGVLHRQRHGKYWLKASVRGYCAYKNPYGDDEPMGISPSERKLEALATIAEMEVAVMAGEMMPVDDVAAVICDRLTNARTILLNLTCRVPPAVRIETRKAVYAVLTELAEGVDGSEVAAKYGSDAGEPE